MKQVRQLIVSFNARPASHLGVLFGSTTKSHIQWETNTTPSAGCGQMWILHQLELVEGKDWLVELLGTYSILHVSPSTIR